MGNNISTAERATLIHDLRGPLITVDGFVAELDRALIELESMIAEHADPGMIATRLTALMDEDLRPCLDYVSSATRSMHERIETLSPEHDGEDGDG